MQLDLNNYRVATLGDSHAKIPLENFINPKININHIGPYTMYRAGRDCIDFRRWVNPDNTDYLIVSFGEIDIRCHINQQTLKGRNLQEIVNTLVINYINMLKYNQIFYKNPIIILMPPPASKKVEPENKEFPYNGSDKERSLYHSLLRNTIYKIANNTFLILDCTDEHVDSNGLLCDMYSYDNCHIHKPKWLSIKLKNLIIDYEILKGETYEESINNRNW